MCTTQHDGKYYDENGRRLFTPEEVLTAVVAYGHTSGTPEQRAEKENLIAEAWSARSKSTLATAG